MVWSGSATGAARLLLPGVDGEAVRVSLIIKLRAPPAHVMAVLASGVATSRLVVLLTTVSTMRVEPAGIAIPGVRRSITMYLGRSLSLDFLRRSQDQVLTRTTEGGGGGRGWNAAATTAISTCMEAGRAQIKPRRLPEREGGRAKRSRK